MRSVLVTGATGYIGGNVADALRRAGHRVYGLVRKAEAGHELAKREIIPIVGDVSDAKTYGDLLDKIDVVVDTAAPAAPAGGSAADVHRILFNEFVARSVKGRRAGRGPKRYVYTSGYLVLGDHEGRVADEDSEAKGINKWRPAYENDITSVSTKSSLVDGANVSHHGIIEASVIRPGWVYGLNHGAGVRKFFGGNAAGDIEIMGNTQKTWPFVHISDLADAFVRVVEGSSANVGGQIFHATDGSVATVEAVRIACARAAGATGKVVNVPVGADFMSKLIEASVIVTSEKLRRTLGWTPRHLSIIAEAETYAASNKANTK